MILERRLRTVSISSLTSAWPMYSHFATVGPEKKKIKEILAGSEYDDGGPCLFSPHPIEDRHACWFLSSGSRNKIDLVYLHTLPEKIC